MTVLASSCYCRCKDTNFKANHNTLWGCEICPIVVIADAKILILKQITTIKLAYAKQAHELITKTTLINPNEPSIDHPDSTFRVYEYIDDCYRIALKSLDLKSLLSFSQMATSIQKNSTVVWQNLMVSKELHNINCLILSIAYKVKISFK